MLNNIIFDRRSLHKAKTLEYPHASMQTTKYGTNKFVMVSALADTGAQSNLWDGKTFKMLVLVRITYFLYQSLFGLLTKFK